MASHNHPAAIPEYGLQDGCPRCAEHATHPFQSLDDDNLRALIARTLVWMRDGSQFPRSDTEAVAMHVCEDAIRHARTFSRLGIEF